MTIVNEVAACLVTLPGRAFVEDGAHLFSVRKSPE